MGWVGFMVTTGLGGVVMTDGIDERATVVEKYLWHIAKRLLSPALIFEFFMQKKKTPPYLPIFLLGFSHIFPSPVSKISFVLKKKV